MSTIRKYDSQTTPDVIAGRVAITDGNSTEVIAAQGARQLMMDSLSIVNMSGTNVYVDILSGVTIIWTAAAPSGAGGSNMPFPKPIPAIAGQALNARVSTGVTTVYVSIGAHILPAA